MSKILIQSYQSDFHGQAIVWGLNELGHNVDLWDPSAFPVGQELSVGLKAGMGVVHTVKTGQEAFVLESFDTLWLRRQPQVTVTKSLHEADQKFALNQSHELIEGFLNSVDESSLFQVNVRANANKINYKIPQLQLARESGFGVPATLFSNDEWEIRDFFAEIKSDVIFKPFSPNFWKGDGETSVSYTVKLTEKNMDGLSAIKYAPGIFQEYIPKAFEVRVVFMGHTHIAFKLDSQNSVDENKVDWRVNQLALPISRIQIPSEIERCCLEFMKAGGIVFGSIDFIVTKDGDYVFLEINEQGQFLGYEVDGVPLMQPFMEFLVSADPEFTWRETSDGLSVRDYIETPGFEAQQVQNKLDNAKHSEAFVSRE